MLPFLMKGAYCPVMRVEDCLMENLEFMERSCLHLLSLGPIMESYNLFDGEESIDTILTTIDTNHKLTQLIHYSCTLDTYIASISAAHGIGVGIGENYSSSVRIFNQGTRILQSASSRCISLSNILALP